MDEQNISYGVDVPSIKHKSWSTRFGGSVTTDEDGKFLIEAVIAGHEYNSNFGVTEDGMYHSFTKFQIEPGQELDLGDMKAKPAPKRYVPPTLEQRIERAFAVEGTAVERFQKAMKSVALVDQHLLILFGNPSDPRSHRFMQIRYEDRDYRRVRDEYRVMAIPTGTEHLDAAKELADELGMTLDDAAAEFSLAIVDSVGKLVVVVGDEELVKDDELSKDNLIELLESHLPDTVDAKDLLAAAMKQAAEQKKRVIVQETATWCGPCHLLSRFLKDNPVWQADFILVKMDHRFQGAQELMKGIRDGASGGIPWYAILDNEGNPIVTSNRAEDGDNIGFPSSDEGIGHFKNMLMQTRNQLTEKQIDALVEKLADR